MTRQAQPAILRWDEAEPRFWKLRRVETGDTVATVIHWHSRSPARGAPRVEARGTLRRDGTPAYPIDGGRFHTIRAAKQAIATEVRMRAVALFGAEAVDIRDGDQPHAAPDHGAHLALC